MHSLIYHVMIRECLLTIPYDPIASNLHFKKPGTSGVPIVKPF
jgi:hypothetical protein